MRLGEEKKIVPVLRYGDFAAGATLDCDSINMKNYHRATFICQIHAMGGAASYALLYSGATDGTLTSALTFNYAFGGAATGAAACDVLAADATSANLSIAHATYDNYMLVIEVEADDMDLANDENWLTLSFADTDTGATGNVTVIAILDPRYKENLSATALT